MDSVGAEHVGPYLMDLYRRNCRPNTIRSRFATILVFLQYLKAKACNLLELVCREDLCAFIEQEQDRGLKPASISCRIDGSVCLHPVFGGPGSPESESTQAQAARQGSRQPATGHRSAGCATAARGDPTAPGPGDGADPVANRHAHRGAVEHNAFRCEHGRETHRDL